MKQVATNEVQLSDEALRQIVERLSQSARPRVLYRPDPHQMAEEALEICQKNARAVLKLLQASLPANHWLRPQIGDVLEEAHEIWDRYPF